jgi:hypothetical protein
MRVFLTHFPTLAGIAADYDSVKVETTFDEWDACVARRA